MSEPDVVISAALGAWLALRRLERRRVTLVDGLLFDGGRPVPSYLATPFRRLLDRGHARVAGAHVHSTDAGRELYGELCQVRGLWLATDRSAPFGSSAAQLFAEDRRC